MAQLGTIVTFWWWSAFFGELFSMVLRVNVNGVIIGYVSLCD